jgi:hypothetical protein
MNMTEFARDMLLLVNLVQSKPEPRVIAIVMASYVETHLEGLLKQKMPGLDQALSKTLFRPSEGALGTLARKINMAQALGVLTPHYAREAKLIGIIRNKFAHNLQVDDFDHAKVAPKVDEMTTARRAQIRRDDKWVDVYPGASRYLKFADGGMAVCSAVMAGNVAEHPFSYKLDPADWPKGVQPPAHEIHIPAPPNE